jgi:hypothetical protein
MRKKKEVEGLTLSIDLPTTVEPIVERSGVKHQTLLSDVSHQIEPPPPKKKKELSEKQRDALKKGMDALREKRKKLLDDDVVKPQPVVAPPPPPAPVVVPEPIVAPPPAPAPAPAPPKVKKVREPRPKYLTADDFNIFKNDLFNTLRPQTKAPEPTIESIVRPTQPNVLSGVSYLDEIFFKRK